MKTFEWIEPENLAPRFYRHAHMPSHRIDVIEDMHGVVTILKHNEDNPWATRLYTGNKYFNEAKALAERFATEIEGLK